MKALLAIALLAASAAHAQTTVTLFPAGGSGALHQYYGVQTNAGYTINLSMPQSSSTGTIYMYRSDQAAPTNCYDCDNWHWEGPYTSPTLMAEWHCYGPLIDRGGFYSQDCALTGNVATLSFTESVRTVRGSGSGRGGYATHRVWTFLGGTITLP